MNITMQTLQKLGQSIGYFMGFVLLTVFLHWISVNLYVKICAPLSLFGVFQVMVSMGSPVCHFLNTAQTEFTKHYVTLWSGAAIALGSWFSATIPRMNNKKSQQKDI